jgi:hypothetical protein
MGNVVDLADALEALIVAPPSAAAIDRKSADYDADAACEGIVQALNATCRRGNANLARE